MKVLKPAKDQLFHCAEVEFCVGFHLFSSWHLVLIPHLHSAHGLFTSHSSPSSLMLLFVELNIGNLFCLSTESIFHAMA